MGQGRPTRSGNTFPMVRRIAGASLKSISASRPRQELGMRHRNSSAYWQSVGYPNNPSYFSFGDGLWSAGANGGLSFDIGKSLLINATAWGSGTTYGAGFYVTSGGTTYVSLVSGNVGHTPSSSPGYWAAVSGNPTTVQRIIVSPPGFFSVAVGDTCSLCFGCDRTPVTCQSVLCLLPLILAGQTLRTIRVFRIWRFRIWLGR